MQVALNLTPIIITLIICVFLYSMCKMARQDKANEKKQADVVVFKGGTGQSKEEQRLREYVEEQVRKGEGTK